MSEKKTILAQCENGVVWGIRLFFIAVIIWGIVEFKALQ